MIHKFKKFENTSIKRKPGDNYDPEVYELFKKYRSNKLKGYSKRDNDNIRIMFNKVQEEFDDGDGDLPKLYYIYKNMNVEVAINICEAYGPTHALVKVSIERKDSFMLINGLYKAMLISEEQLKYIQLKAQNYLDILTNIL
jgi:hypothetical protein